ncbi:hypothetical protein ADU59_28385 [Pararhizobium polonicum]|uniref:Uncharacterized protein n=1 Tax=Pararhizobium polonicum TaxID=1612624 RepID=A0A1C7NSZ2_9HYPH|nr:hypothetical protein ADU59_28385 [Pararhizobium polonicum]
MILFEVTAHEPKKNIEMAATGHGAKEIVTTLRQVADRNGNDIRQYGSSRMTRNKFISDTN